MRKIIIILIVLSFITILLFDIPKYSELNNISVIDKIKVKCHQNYYDVTLREVTLYRRDSGVTFRYNYYENDVKNLANLKEDYSDKYHKIFYYDKVKYLETNCDNIDVLKKMFNNKIIINKIKG